MQVNQLPWPDDQRQDHLHIVTRKRMHSSIGYHTPAQALNGYQTAAQAA
jgi:hypothetical protein